MHLDHAVGDEVEQCRKQGIDYLQLLHKLDLDGKVPAFIETLSFMAVFVMVLAETSLRAQHRCACYAARKKEGKNLLMDKTVICARIFIQVNRNFFGGAWLQHRVNVLIAIHTAFELPRNSARSGNRAGNRKSRLSFPVCDETNLLSLKIF